MPDPQPKQLTYQPESSPNNIHETKTSKQTEKQFVKRNLNHFQVWILSSTEICLMLFTTVHSSPGSCALVLSDLQSEQLKVSTYIQWIIDQIFPMKNRYKDNSGSAVSLTTAHRLPNSTFAVFYE